MSCAAAQRSSPPPEVALGSKLTRSASLGLRSALGCSTRPSLPGAALGHALWLAAGVEKIMWHGGGGGNACRWAQLAAKNLRRGNIHSMALCRLYFRAGLGKRRLLCDLNVARWWQSRRGSKGKRPL